MDFQKLDRGPPIPCSAMKNKNNISLFHIFDREHCCTGPPLNSLGKKFSPIYHPTIILVVVFYELYEAEKNTMLLFMLLWCVKVCTCKTLKFRKHLIFPQGQALQLEHFVVFRNMLMVLGEN